MGGGAEENKAIALSILKGEKGPKRDMVILNAAVALYTALEDQDLKSCIGLAENLIDSGKAMEKLEAFIKATNSFRKEAI